MNHKNSSLLARITQRRQSALILWAILCASISAAITYNIYPFLLTADGAIRWRYAMELLGGPPVAHFNLLLPLNSILMAGTHFISGEYGLYTFLQSFFVLFSGCCLILYLLWPPWDIQTHRASITTVVSMALFTGFPTISIYSVVLTDSALTFSALVFAILLLDSKLFSSSPDSPTILRQLLHFLAMLLTFTILFGLRYNTLTVLPVILWLIFWSKTLTRQQRVVAFLGLVLAFCVVRLAIPQWCKLPNRAPHALGMGWELVGIFSETKDPRVRETLRYFGKVPPMVLAYHPQLLNTLEWDGTAPLPAEAISKPEAAALITATFFDYIYRQPLQYTKFKLRQWGLTLGITEPLLEAARGIHEHIPGDEPFAARVNNRENRVLNIFVDITQMLSFITLRPIVAFTLAGCIIWGLWRIKARGLHLYSAVFAAAVCYYGGFLVQTQAMEYRYFMPSFALCLIIIIAGGAEIFVLRRFRANEQ